jgi:hypothetical protein
MNNPTSMAQPLNFAESVVSKRDAGLLSELDVNSAMQSLAEVYYSGSMSKLLESNVGKVFLRPRTARKSVAEEAALQKKAQPAVSLDDNSDSEPWDKQIKRLTDAGLSADEAASFLHRKEKLRKGLLY